MNARTIVRDSMDPLAATKTLPQMESRAALGQRQMTLPCKS